MIIQHDSVIATTTIESEVKALKEYIKSVGEEYFLVSEVMCNGTTTVVMPPDGSGEGRPVSNRGDRRRADFIWWLRDRRYWHGIIVSWGEIKITISEV